MLLQEIPQIFQEETQRPLLAQRVGRENHQAAQVLPHASRRFVQGSSQSNEG